MTMTDEAIDKLLSEAESGMSGSTWWEMIDALRQLQAENKALREDAERYRLIRLSISPFIVEHQGRMGWFPVHGEQLDAIADAALQQEDRH